MLLKGPQGTQQPPTTKTHLAPNANSANVEKSCSQMSEYIRTIQSNQCVSVQFSSVAQSCIQCILIQIIENKNSRKHLLDLTLFQALYSHSEKAMATHSSTLAQKISWTEEPGRLQSMGSLRVGHDCVSSLSLFIFMPWRRKWQPTPVFLPGESQGWGSLGFSVCGVTELDTTEVTQQQQQHTHITWFILFNLLNTLRSTPPLAPFKMLGN